MNKHHAELKNAVFMALAELIGDETVDTYEMADDLREVIDLCYMRIHGLGTKADRPKGKVGRNRKGS